MRSTLATVLALAAVAGVVLLSHPADAKDDYVQTLVPGADAGTLAQTTTAFTIKGKQLMVRCTQHAVTARLCETTSCSATINDTVIDADKSVDVCSLSGDTTLSLFRTYDAGLPSCRVYTVNPKTVCPQ